MHCIINSHPKKKEKKKGLSFRMGDEYWEWLVNFIFNSNNKTQIQELKETLEQTLYSLDHNASKFFNKLRVLTKWKCNFLLPIIWSIINFNEKVIKFLKKIYANFDEHRVLKLKMTKLIKNLWYEKW